MPQNTYEKSPSYYTLLTVFVFQHWCEKTLKGTAHKQVILANRSSAWVKLGHSFAGKYSHQTPYTNE